jgi:hypothetical protein
VNDTRNADKENLDDDASNTLIIVLAHYLKRIVIFKNHRVQANIRGEGVVNQGVYEGVVNQGVYVFSSPDPKGQVSYCHH